MHATLLKTVEALSIYIGLALISSQGYAQGIPGRDTSALKKDFWRSKTVKISVVPVILFAGSAATWAVRKDVRTLRNRYLPTFRYHYDDYLQYAPVAVALGLNAAGVKGKNKIGRALVSYAFSATIMASLVNTVKYTAKVERPDGSSRNSFPSGHTANSFMNATFLHKEYGQYRSPLFSVGAYTAATATAVGRELNNRHWVSDVLAGAGIGILSTELGYIIADKIFKENGKNIKLKNNPVPVKWKPSFIELRLGYAHALGNDLAKNSEDLYARTGFNFGLEGAYFVSRNIGLGGEFAFSSFPINDDNTDFSDPVISQISDGHFTQPMGIRYLHVGTYLSFPLPRNWFLTSKLGIGTSEGARGQAVLNIREAYQDIFHTTELPYASYKPNRALSWSAGIGIQKQIKRNVGIKAYTSYFGSKNNFETDILDELDANGKATFKSFSSEKINFSNLSCGLALTAFLW